MDIEATIRDLVSRTLPTPLPAEFDRTVENQPELPQPIRAKSGTARITANDGGGAYKITETTGGEGGLAAMAAPAGFVDRVAYAIDNADSWEVDDDVFYMQVPTAAGGFATYIERGLEGPGYLQDSTGLTGCWIENLRIRRGKLVAFSKFTGGAQIWYDAETLEVIP
jgi:hypothetical protein